MEPNTNSSTGLGANNQNQTNNYYGGMVFHPATSTSTAATTPTASTIPTQMEAPSLSSPDPDTQQGVSPSSLSGNTQPPTSPTASNKHFPWGKLLLMVAVVFLLWRGVAAAQAG